MSQTQAPPPPTTDPQAARRLRFDWRLWLERLGPLLALLAIFGFFAWQVPSFASSHNISMLLTQTMVVGIAALGMTMVIILGGIDLSVGSVVAMAGVVVALVLQAGNESYVTNHPTLWPLLAAAAGVGAALLAGLLNGVLITRLKVVPFIVTLGMLGIARGLAKALGDNQKVDAPLTWLNDLVTRPAGHPFPPGVWVLLGLAAAVAAFLHYTRLGRHTFAIGSSPATARLCGVHVERVKLFIYAAMGAMAGLAGLMQFGRLSVGDPTVAVGLELEVIAAVVIGGGSLAGGEGSILGTLVGALIMTVINAGCSQMGWDNWVQEIVTGAIIIVAVALDRLRHRTA